MNSHAIRTASAHPGWVHHPETPLRIRRTLPVRSGRRSASVDWFTPWFSSPYYHILYRNRDESEARFFVDNLSRFLRLGPDSRVLDLGCGKGRHAVHLSSTGADVTGLDISHSSIAEARKNGHARLRFVVGDMRDDYGREDYSHIVNLFTSFGYFTHDEENVRSIKQASRALISGGKLVIDFLNAKKVRSNLVPEESKYINGIEFEIRRRLCAGFFLKDILIRHLERIHWFQERVRALQLDDFLTYSEAAGLNLVDVFGDYSLKPFDASKSDRLIMIFQKPSESR